MLQVKIIQASSEHLDELSKLFDKYRVFYKEPSDIEAARNFLQERLMKVSDKFVCYICNKCGMVSVAIPSNHEYECNKCNNYLASLKAAGLIVSGVSDDEMLVEVIELSDHPWYIACQFHPEFTSTPRKGHPLFTGFIAASLARLHGSAMEGRVE